MARSSYPTTAVGAALLLVVGDAVAAVAGGFIAAMIIGFGLVEIIHSRRAAAFGRHLKDLEAHLRDGIAEVKQRQAALQRIGNGTHDDVSALVHLTRRQIHVEKRITGDEPTGPNPRYN